MAELFTLHEMDGFRRLVLAMEELGRVAESSATAFDAMQLFLCVRDRRIARRIARRTGLKFSRDQHGFFVFPDRR